MEGVRRKVRRPFSRVESHRRNYGGLPHPWKVSAEKCDALSHVWKVTVKTYIDLPHVRKAFAEKVRQFQFAGRFITKKERFFRHCTDSNRSALVGPGMSGLNLDFKIRSQPVYSLLNHAEAGVDRSVSGLGEGPDGCADGGRGAGPGSAPHHSPVSIFVLAGLFFKKRVGNLH